MEKYSVKTLCRICGGKDFMLVLDLGEMPVSNAFVSPARLTEKEDIFPLTVHLCKLCKSLQLRYAVSSELIFKNYHYATGASRPLVEHFNTLADEIVETFVESPRDLVIEIGSNDGSLLSRIKNKCRILGIDPADNIVQIAEQNGVPTRVGFFSSQLAERVRADVGFAQVIVANNVMAHIENIRDVFVGVRNLLTDDGTFIFEVHWVGNLLTDGGFDQIYHEHFYYHSLSSLKILLDSLDMEIRDVKLVPIHGESMRVYAGKTRRSLSDSSMAATRVEDFLQREKEMGLTEENTYKSFSEKVERNKTELLALLAELVASGKKIAGYGAPAKGNTLLNYFNIGTDTLSYITDTTPSKQGYYTPGSRIPIVAPDAIYSRMPDYILLLSWNYAESILEKEKALREKGVKFIIPVPTVRVL